MSWYQQQNLLDAIREGNVANLKKAIEKGADVNERGGNYEGRYPIHIAAQSKSLECLEALVDAGADVNTTDNHGAIPLHCVDSNKEIAIVQYLVEHTENVNAYNHFGTPLHLAINKNNEDVIEVLLTRQDIDVNAQTKKNVYRSNEKLNDKTPLHLAIEAGNVNIINMLIVKDADLNIQDAQGKTPLHLAIKAYASEMDEAHNAMLASKEALENGDNRSAELNERIAREHKDNAAKLLEVVKLLLKHKDINANIQDAQGRTPLHLAIENGDVDIVGTLLDHTNVDVNLKR